MAKAKNYPPANGEHRYMTTQKFCQTVKRKNICGLLEPIRKKSLNTWHHSTVCLY